MCQKRTKIYEKNFNNTIFPTIANEKDLKMGEYTGDNLFEKLGTFVPGYPGYAQREGRRKTDKMLRINISRLLDDQKETLDAATKMLLNEKALDLVTAIDEVRRILDLTANKIRLAEYGSSGFFDLVQIKEQELDRLYSFDLSLKEMTEGMSPILAKLKSVETVEPACHEACTLLRSIQKAVEQRNAVMKEI